MNSGDPNKISKLLRDLYTLDQTNELKGKEREIMEQAKKFLLDEITYISADSKIKVTDDIQESLKMMYKKKVMKDREARKKNAATPL
jgi:RNA polymerase-interacting CarD/CdnL/TRCF family regulator